MFMFQEVLEHVGKLMEEKRQSIQGHEGHLKSVFLGQWETLQNFKCMQKETDIPFVDISWVF
jgi:hypothetical protein